METQLKAFTEAHQRLSFEKVERKFVSDEGEEVYTYFYIKGIKGIPDLQIHIRKEEDIEYLQRVVESECTLMSDLLGYRNDDGIHILARPETPVYSSRSEHSNPIELKLSYGSKPISIKIEPIEEDTLLGDVAYLVSRRRGSYIMRGFQISITGLGARRYLKDSLEQDTESILDSVLYDLDLTYGFGLIPRRVDAVRRMMRRRIRPRTSLPQEPLNLIYKEYAPELLQYYRLAKRTDYLPFQFLCYFHILEFFADRSAYRSVTEAVKRMLAKHDFHAKSDKYIRECVQVLRKESDKHSSDKIKVQRVLTQYVEQADIRAALDELDVLDHFEQECVLECSKELKLSGISFESDSRFFQTLTTRIYALRCSIVHSNPDFDESKAIPFVASSTNLEKLRSEIILVEEIAKQIIAGSAAMA
ncbi:hypothetical protein SH580_20395 [Coraliomargarita algicola]|uniref:Apea-like HEPN domain-containing protein n=1 Tax=Coraliomargarita algicola TaxID=3092156 RepID=A0ABZ0RLI7_9BACT|nr:hypothetical protein [Coraliomargarita sp. J2-16]WPJ95782.1 hypothetical protein SH580_20395 [Coraliomargarita sp. J2-16]